MSSNQHIGTAPDYVRIIEGYAPFFDRPEERIRFLRQTTAIVQQEILPAPPRRMAFIAGSRFRSWLLKCKLYNRLFAALHEHLPKKFSERRQAIQRIDPKGRMFFRLYLFRHVLYGATAVLVLGALVGLYAAARWTFRSIAAPRASAAASGPTSESRTPSQATAPNVTVTDHLPGYQPEKVWLVERKADYELYSNGARIMLDYETDTRPRAFQALARGTLSAEPDVRRDPVGIVYHTSENDLLPFTPDNSKSIEALGEDLLKFARRHESYNYVIDRFGQIHRIVRDDQVANHAGNSIWGDKKLVYVGLNESFLGVCFDTRTEAGALDEQLTEAQLIAGRLLTAILRSRYNIEDANCVTHGMVSVNPSNMLIGYHYDWVRNFPFQAMGLSDKYSVPPASISEFGFTYDNSFVQKLGGTLWPGIHEAEQAFEHRAAQAGLTPAEMRARSRKVYLAYIGPARGLLRETPSASADPAPSPDKAAADR